MELRKALKSLVALGTGATLVGATVLSALAAADLSTYPAPFVKAGAYDALIVVGASAKTDDVLGSVDIATSLQAANTVVKTVPGTATTTTVEGDAFRIDSAADFLEKGEALNAVGVTTLTSGDLDALKDGTITNAKGTFTVKQSLTVNTGTPVFAVDPDDSTDTPAWYFKVNNAAAVYTYKATFTPALESDVDSAEDLDDLDKKSISMFGKSFTVVDTYCPDTGQACRIDFMAGSAGDTLNVGESKTYTVGSTDYEVTLSYTDGTYAKFTVNGVTTASLAIGETDVLADGSQIGVSDILYQNYAGGVQQVEFYVGATKIRIAETALNLGTGASVVVGSNTVTDVVGSLKGTNGTVTKIDYLQFVWTADEDIYLASGKKLSDSLYEDDGQMFLNFDIEYKGLQEDTVKDTIELASVGDDEYKLKFTNKAGDVVNVPLYDVDTMTMKWGDETYDLILKEATNNLGNWSLGSAYIIDRNDYFVVSDSSSKNTYLMRYKSMDATDNVIEFEDIGSAAEAKISYTFTNNVTSAGHLTMGGTDYDVYIAGDLNSAQLMMDLDASATNVLNTLPTWYTRYGARIDVLNTLALPQFNVSAEAGDDTVGQTAPTDTITVRVINGTTADTTEIGTVAGGTMTSTLQSIGATNNKEDWTQWGTRVYKTYAESGPDKLTITYPDDQTEHLVYYTSGATTSSTTTGGTTYNEVVAIGVDASVLDTEVTDFKAQNIIIVGGPCVNLAAAEVMGNPAVCTTGFVEGKAMIKLYERTNGKVALLVAGMTGMDTRRAARALGEYGSHKLTGTEMEVAGTSLTQYTVTAVTTA